MSPSSGCFPISPLPMNQHTWCRWLPNGSVCRSQGAVLRTVWLDEKRVQILEIITSIFLTEKMSKAEYQERGNREVSSEALSYPFCFLPFFLIKKIVMELRIEPGASNMLGKLLAAVFHPSFANPLSSSAVLHLQDGMAAPSSSQNASAVEVVFVSDFSFPFLGK